MENGVAINVKYALNGKTPVLFLHFSGGTLHMWNGIIPLFDSDFSIIAPDFRGHGKSDKLLTGHHIDDMANDIYLLLKELNIIECHVIGSSLGAEVGLSFAATHPEMILSLICEGALYNEFGEFGLFNGSIEEIEAEKQKLKKHLRERTMPRHESKESYFNEIKQSFQKHGLWNEHFSAYAESCIQDTGTGYYTNHYPNEVRIEYIEKYWDLRFEEYYEKVTCPILFLPSEEEWKNEKIKRSFQKFSSYVDSYDLVHIDNAIHAYVWMQNPLVVGKVAKDFIGRIEGSSLVES
ncbi:2-succinyl-6-hydroxy-2,4-cyclohexadiene-1-carboxylate synthase [Salirhabdus euzebyi]|uniref:2-succinyl-6-hydroxy-2, 4-cyclohexadiene-1-carboxylate synthase n=1 Tax=Salirhabdus euzebyi TaxID=394506 RepID=A0A841Q4F3_9BACI|nr:alpha/beta hydrolase [Salirhabdus euzebyi]MBB6453243.1 2-succinyl-6-hydroxy-2,4-cyclohexadiene-1-carboxylate synthase [Salirhabdus euzebyi]